MPPPDPPPFSVSPFQASDKSHMKDLPFHRWLELRDKAGSEVTDRPSAGNREFTDSSDTAVLGLWRLQGVSLHVCTWYLRVFIHLSLRPRMHEVFFLWRIITACYEKTKLQISPNKCVLPKIHTIHICPWETRGGTTTPNIWWRWAQTVVMLTLRRANCCGLDFLTVAFSSAGRSAEMYCWKRRAAYSDPFSSQVM